MKNCTLCGQLYEESYLDDNPAMQLGEIFADSMVSEEKSAICPDCLGRTGILNLLGFGR